MNKILFIFRSLVLLLIALSGFNFRAAAVTANAWHISDDTNDLTSTNMRSPEFEIGPNTTVTIYSGLQKFNNSFGTANQTGGWVYFKGATQNSWSSNALSFYLTSGNNQFWSGTFNSSSFGTNEVIQYYLYLTFDGVNGIQNTYVYGGGDAGGSQDSISQSMAAANPFTIRNRAAWVWHNGNRVITAGSDLSHMNVTFSTKIGYLSKNNAPASSWVNQAAIYYTTNGAAPIGALGVAGANTFAAPIIYDHEEDDPSIAGNAMWWVATVTNLPLYSGIHYKIGVWNSANNEEKFGDYNSGSPNAIFSFTNGTLGDPQVTVNGVNADYTTTHVFVNELTGDAIPLTILFSPNTSNVIEADVFSNLNRRNRATMDANGDGIEDGIVPPDGNLIPTGDDNNYYKAYAMTSLGGGQFSLTLYATNCGAYRLTARYKISGNTNWFWYSGTDGLRDHCIVATPVKARNMVMYELNAMNIDAQGTNQGDRSTFTDLYNGPGSRPYDAVTNRFNLNYFQNLGVNWLWFQPIHPIGIMNRQTDGNGQPFSVGSPYSVKNFFQVNPLLSKANTRAAALQEFTNFVAAADAAGVNVMLDEPFNHSAWDAELDAAGTNFFAPASNPTNIIMNSEARFYSRTGEYDERASGAASVAQAPDRFDFGKWTDVADIYFGRYAALVPNSSSSGNYTSEADWFDYTTGNENITGSGNGHFDQITQNVWRYFSDCILYWLDKTGCPNGTPANQTDKGIDGLRADFGQGLPPQCWEYIINKVRTRKWDFVFMTESLDGGAVTYRSNRHFDVLNESLLFDLQSAATASDYRNAFDARRNSYGQGLVLLNNVSHDEQSYADPYAALIRYMACGAVDGAPMTFYGEELGISTAFGFNLYQLNFGKTIPHFMVYNSLQPICNPANRTFGLDQLAPVYAGVNQARNFSAALKSSNRYYLNQTGSETAQANIFSVAKYENANGAPNFNDVVFAFTTLDRNNSQSGNFDVNISQNGSNLFGIQPARIYNVKNISAYIAIDGNRRNYWLWNGGNGGIAGSNVLANGIFVSLNPVPASDAAWSSAPFEAQYLKLYDVTPPPAPAAPQISGTTNNYIFTNIVMFTWNISDSQGGISGYHVLVGTTPAGSDVFNGIVTGTSLSVTNNFGAHLYATVSAVNNAGIESSATTSSGIALVNPAWIPVADLTTPALLNWSSVSGEIYQVWSTTNLSVPFAAFSGMVTATAPTVTFTNNPTNAARYFKIQLIP